MKTRTFVDCVRVEARAGKGGTGACSFRREANVDHGGPDGGDGGRGGHVIFLGDRDEDSLLRLYYAPLLYAKDGGPGRGQQMHGRDAEDLVVKVPCGTEVYDDETDVRLFDIIAHGQREVVAEGGRGGWGNVHWKRATHQAPTEFTPGLPGAEHRLRLELKLLADVGLVGFPNAGKSSLLRAISDAHPKVAAYPFTTINPIVGAVCYPDYSQIRVADIPGIVEGAHEGIGLGHDFLRHLARSRVLVYIVDTAGCDGRNPWADYRALRRELALHDPLLPKRPSLLVANKMDLPGAAENLDLLVRRAGRKALPISTVDGQGIDALKARLHELVKPVARSVRLDDAPPPPAPPARRRPAAPDPVAPPPEPEDDVVSPEKLARAGFFDLSTRKPRR